MAESVKEYFTRFLNDYLTNHKSNTLRNLEFVVDNYNQGKINDSTYAKQMLGYTDGISGRLLVASRKYPQQPDESDEDYADRDALINKLSKEYTERFNRKYNVPQRPRSPSPSSIRRPSAPEPDTDLNDKQYEKSKDRYKEVIPKKEFATYAGRLPFEKFKRGGRKWI